MFQQAVTGIVNIILIPGHPFKPEQRDWLLHIHNFGREGFAAFIAWCGENL